MSQPHSFLIGAALVMSLTGGCSREPESAAPSASAPAAAAPAETPGSAGIRTVHYTCADGRSIEAQYDNSNPERPGANLLIDGRRFELYSVVAASGARYATESGFKPDHGLQWWTNGEEATLSEMVMDHTAGGPTELTKCRAAPPNPA